MAKRLLSTAERKRLYKIATPEGALGYGAWLSERGKKSAKEQKAQTSARRDAPDYGVSGASLGEGGLRDDGYAAYLRHAAKQAREERARRMAATQDAEAGNALRGYAAYLEGERAASADRLGALGDVLSEGTLTPEEARAQIRAVTEKADTRKALTALYERYKKSQEPEAPQEEARPAPDVIAGEIFARRLPYHRAVLYCTERGYSRREAELLAERITATYEGSLRQLQSLFTYP